MSDQSDSWWVPQGADLRWRSWTGGIVVYDCRSGDTHLLEPVAAEELRRLQASPASGDELGRDVAADLGLEADEAYLAQFDVLLHRFDALGLIERCR